MFPTSRPSPSSSSSSTPPKKRQRYNKVNDINYNKENDINYVNKNNGGDNNPLPTDWTNICCGGGVCSSSSSHPSSSAAPLSQQLPPLPFPSSTAPLSSTKTRKPLQTKSTNK